MEESFMYPKLEVSSFINLLLVKFRLMLTRRILFRRVPFVVLVRILLFLKEDFVLKIFMLLFKSINICENSYGNFKSLKKEVVGDVVRRSLLLMSKVVMLFIKS